MVIIWLLIASWDDDLKHNTSIGQINTERPYNLEYILVLHVPSVSNHVNEVNVIAKVSEWVTEGEKQTE